MGQLPIIAFSKDWTGDHTSNHHVLRELAKTRRVLWINSIGTRAPSLASGRDLGTIRRKLTEVAKAAQNVENDLWVVTPLVLPMAKSPAMRKLNRLLIKTLIGAARRRLGIEAFELWTFLPNVADYLDLGQAITVYYCVDEWSLFEYLDKDATVSAERELLKRTDVVFAINRSLAEAKRPFVPSTFVSPHGVDHALFSRALDPTTTIPAALAAIPRPRIGFVGTLRDWVDLELVAHIARSRPQWQVVLVGRKLMDTSVLDGIPNIHLIDAVPHKELPHYFAGYDVGIIPYRRQTRMTFVNPLKLREYLAGGLPVVSTPLDEAEKYPEICAVAEDRDDFVAAIELALRNDSPAARRARSEAMRAETWHARVVRLEKHIDDFLEHGSQQSLSERVPYLVTGAAGRLGRAVVTRLRAEGNLVRIFVRHIPRVPLDGIEYVVGDLADADAVDRAVRGAEVVIHAAATMRGDWAAHESGTIAGTRNVIAACTAHRTKQLVYISSLSVVDFAGSSVIDESVALEPHPEARGFYTQAKLAAEQLVTAAAKRGLPCVILRPGQIFGGGIAPINGAVARNAGGRWLILGDGSLELPLVYIDDVVDGITAAITRKLVDGQIIQLVDPVHLTQAELLDAAGGQRGRIAIPRSVVFALGGLSELPLKLLGKTSPIAKYRLESALARVEYRSERARQLLGWEPRVGVRAGLVAGPKP